MINYSNFIFHKDYAPSMARHCLNLTDREIVSAASVNKAWRQFIISEWKNSQTKFVNLICDIWTQFLDKNEDASVHFFETERLYTNVLAFKATFQGTLLINSSLAKMVISMTEVRLTILPPRILMKSDFTMNPNSLQEQMLDSAIIPYYCKNFEKLDTDQDLFKYTSAEEFHTYALTLTNNTNKAHCYQSIKHLLKSDSLLTRNIIINLPRNCLDLSLACTQLLFSEGFISEAFVVINEANSRDSKYFPYYASLLRKYLLSDCEIPAIISAEDQQWRVQLLVDYIELLIDSTEPNAYDQILFTVVKMNEVKAIRECMSKFMRFGEADKLLSFVDNLSVAAKKAYNFYYIEYLTTCRNFYIDAFLVQKDYASALLYSKQGALDKVLEIYKKLLNDDTISKDFAIAMILGYCGGDNPSIKLRRDNIVTVLGLLDIVTASKFVSNLEENEDQKYIRNDFLIRLIKTQEFKEITTLIDRVQIPSDRAELLGHVVKLAKEIDLDHAVLYFDDAFPFIDNLRNPLRFIQSTFPAAISKAIREKDKALIDRAKSCLVALKTRLPPEEYSSAFILIVEGYTKFKELMLASSIIDHPTYLNSSDKIKAIQQMTRLALESIEGDRTDFRRLIQIIGKHQQGNLSNILACYLANLVKKKNKPTALAFLDFIPQGWKGVCEEAIRNPNSF